MTDLLTTAKKVMKAISRADSVYTAIKRTDPIRAITRGIALIDDIAEIAIKLLEPKEEK